MNTYTFARRGSFGQVIFARKQPDGIIAPPTLDKATRFARPARDLANLGWTPSSGSSLFGMLNEAVPSADESISTSSAARCELGLGPVAAPGTSSGQVLRYEAHGDGSLTVNFKQGTRLIASFYHATLPAEFTMHEGELTAEQCDAITDYRDLRVELVVA